MPVGPQRLYNKAVRRRKRAAKRSRRAMHGGLNRMSRTRSQYRMHRDGATEGSSRGL